MLAHAFRTKFRSLCVLVLLLKADLASSRNGGSPASSRGSPSGNGERAHHGDRFVRAAPLIVGVNCNDGVLLVAAHTFDDDEPLLYFNPSGSDEAVTSETSGNSTSIPDVTRDGWFRNLPHYYAGPFRIQVVDPTSRLVLSSTGWRADCDDLVRTARGLAAYEVSTYGPPPSRGASTEEAFRRGTILSHDLSLYLAACAVSESARAKSCVGLLASPSCLWLIDSTGAIPVRALCVGGGGATAAATPAAPDSVDVASRPTAVSDAVNDRLMQVADWTRLDCNQVLEELLKILGDEAGSDSSPPTATRQPLPLLRRGTRLEVTFVGRSKVTRHRLPEVSTRSSA